MEVELGLTKSVPPVASGGSYLLLVSLKLFFCCCCCSKEKVGGSFGVRMFDHIFNFYS